MAFEWEPGRVERIRETEYVPPSSGTSTGFVSEGGGAAAPIAGEDPWTRIGDVLAGIQAPGIAIPEPQAQTVTYVPGTGTNWMALLLLMAAAGGAYYWYTKRKGG